ncbi:MAG: ankyrin repeat domain-containing protein [Desulfomonilia bacterium]
MIRLQKHIQVLAILLALVCASTSTWANSEKSDLIKAAQEGNLSRVRALIAAKAEVNVKADKGYTALMMATLNGHRVAVQLLKMAGAVD